MTWIFDELIHNQVECYIDDLMVKSHERQDHRYDLRIIFELLRRYDLKKNPLNCSSCVTSGKILGFVVRHRGIKIDHSEVKAILDMPTSRCLTQLR